MAQRPLILLAGLFVFAGCNGDGATPDDSGEIVDTGEAWYDPGCILIEEGRSEGYALLSDAVSVAAEGDTIDLSACGSMDQGAQIAKSLTIKGSGPEFVWTAPVNEPAAVITGASGVVLSNFTLISTRNGIEVDSSSDVLIEGVVFAEIANTGVKASNSTEVVVSDSSFVAPRYGAMELSGGSGTLRDSEVDSAQGFVVHAIDGASATATGNTVTNTTYTELNAEGGIDDGFAFWAENADMTTADNVMTNNIVAVFVNQGNTSMTGDQITGGLYGVYGVFGASDIEDVSVIDAATVGGIFVTQTDNIRVVGSTFQTDPASSFDSFDDPDAWTGGGLIVQTDGEVEIAGVDVSGWNALGVSIAGRDDSVLADVSDLTVSDCGRFGLILASGDFVVTDTFIEDLRLADDPELVNVGGSLSVGYGVSASNADVVWTGGGISNTAVTSATIQNSTWTMDGAAVSNGGWDSDGIGIGLWGLSSTLNISNTSFSKSPNYGGIANYFGTLIADNLEFVDNDWEYSYSTNWYMFYGYDAVGAVDSTTFTAGVDFVANGLKVGDRFYIYNTGEYLEVASITSASEVELTAFPLSDPTGSSFAVYRDATAYSSWYSVDIVSNAAITTEIRNSSFTTGADGIQLIGGDSDVLLENLSFTDYNDSAIYVYRSETDPSYGDIEILDVSMNNIGYTGVRCVNASIDVENLSIDGTLERSNSTTYLDAEGTELYSSSYSSSGVAAFYNDGCETTVDGMSVTGATWNAFLSLGGALDLTDVSITGGSTDVSGTEATMEVRWASDEAPVLVASGLEISGAGGDALRVWGNGQTGSVILSGVSISDAGEDGLSLISMSDALISGMSVSGSAGNGVVTGGATTLDGASLTGNGGYGFWAGQDQDGDGQTVAEGDCNDFDATAYVGAYESTSTWLDTDCDGLAGDPNWTTSDLDGDGYGIDDGDCDEYDTTRNPGASDTPGVDGDCDGVAGPLEGTITLSNSTLSANASGGLFLQGHDGRVDDNTITGNTGYGMTCESGVSFESCDDNTLSGNTLGELDGCDSSCGS